MKRLVTHIMLPGGLRVELDPPIEFQEGKSLPLDLICANRAVAQVMKLEWIEIDNDETQEAPSVDQAPALSPYVPWAEFRGFVSVVIAAFQEVAASGRLAPIMDQMREFLSMGLRKE